MPVPDPLAEGVIPARWLRDQQFILAITRHVENVEPTVEDQRALFSYLWNGKDTPPPLGSPDYRRRLEELPPTALELLCDLTGDHVDMWEEHQVVWKATLSRLQWDNAPDRRLSRFSGAKLLADRISTGWLEPRQLCRVAWLEMRADGWEKVRDIDPKLRRLTAAMLDATNAYQRLAALAAFGQGPLPSQWPMIENVLLQQIFSWPLLIAENDVSYAMPAIVTLEPGAAGADGRTAIVIEGDNIDAQDWQEHVDKARVAAIRLWEAKKGTDAGPFEAMVMDSRVTLDLRLASAIFEHQFPGGWVKLVDGSLGTYVALEILSQLFGLTTAGRIAATGVLGGPLPNGFGDFRSRGGDYSVQRVSPQDTWIFAKVDCARRSFFFDKIIVPSGANTAGRLSYLQVLEANTLEGYAKPALGQHWRNHRYGRCVDIAETFKAEKAPSRAVPKKHNQSPQAVAILRRCHDSQSPVLELGETFSGADVAHALYWALEDAKDDRSPCFNRDDPDRGFRKIPAEERRGHYAFVRASADEQGERFWATIWDVCGGSVESFHQFTRSSSVAEAAQHLAALLNTVAPTEDRRSPAPDILVIVGANRLAGRDPRVTENDNPAEIFRLARLAKYLRANDLLAPCANPVLRVQLPKVRLIMVDEGQVTRIPVSTDDLPEDLRRAFLAFSIFRHGFSLPMAQTVLGADRIATEKILDAMLDLSRGGVCLAGRSDKTNEYWLNYEPVSRNSARTFTAHLGAAAAISGFLDRSDRPQHQEFGEALKPENLHEAQWHVEAAIKLARHHSTDGKLALSYRERLSRIGEPFTWSQLAWINRHSREAGTETWQAIRGAVKSTGPMNLHPLRLLQIARFAHGLSNRLAGRKRYFASAYRRILIFALARCETLPANSRRAAEFSILTARAWMTMKAQPHKDGAALAATDNAKAWACCRDAVEIPYAEWFEHYGDAIADTAEARQRYARGFLNPDLPGANGMRLSTMVKWLGCQVLLGKPVTRAQWDDLTMALSDNHLAELRDWARTGKVPKSGLYRERDAQTRWVTGMRLLMNRKVV